MICDRYYQGTAGIGFWAILQCMHTLKWHSVNLKVQLEKMSIANSSTVTIKKGGRGEKVWLIRKKIGKLYKRLSLKKNTESIKDKNNKEKGQQII